MPESTPSRPDLSRPLRIALVSSSYLPHLGGVEEHTRQLAAQLRMRGHAVEIWTVRRDGLDRTELIEGIPVRRLPAPLPAGELAAAARFLATVPAAAARWMAASRSFAPDLLHVHCFGPNGVFADALSRITATPVVLSLHGETFMDDYDVFGQSRLLRASLRRALQRAAVVTGCSQLTLDDAINRFGLQQGTVVFNGVEPAQAELEPAAEPARSRPYVLGMGRMVRNKGFDLLLEAFAIVAAKTDELDLVLVGDGPERAALGQQAQELGLSDRVKLPGRADRAGVASALGNAALFVMPSRVEPFGIVVLEAWRAGTAVICTSRGGAAEIVRTDQDALVVDPCDVAALAGALQRGLDDPALRTRLRAAGAIRVEEFSIAASAQHYESLYRSATARAA